MEQILKLSLALTLLLCLIPFFSVIVEDGVVIGLYYAILGFGSFFLPTLTFVAIYHFLFSKRFNFPNLWLTYMSKSLTLIFVSFIGLFVWAILEFVITSGFNLDMNLIFEDYRKEYLGYMSAVIILASLIPIGHHLFRPKLKAN
ncbi:MAG: hypothetical protein IPM69_08215 [Ignavibacteria bacterium]|nr:hypothetical protein [Ignavibacteria bacterium]